MRKVMAIILVAVMMFAFVPAASAAWGADNMKLASSGSWINVPSSADIDVKVDDDGNYTIRIAVPFSKISSVYQGTYPWGYYEKAFFLPIIPNDMSEPVIVDGASNIYSRQYCIKFVPRSGGKTETFSVMNGASAMSVSIEYVDAKELDDWYYPGLPWYPGYPTHPDYMFPNYQGTYYCADCGKNVTAHSSYYYDGYYYLTCSKGHLTRSSYAGGVYPTLSYLQVVGVVAYGDQYANVTASNTGAQISLSVAANAYYAKDDSVRIRVKPLTNTGATYPAGTVVAAVSPTSTAHLAGSDTSLNSNGTYSYVLDKNGAFCINISGIKNMVGKSSGTWGTLSVKVGNSNRVDTTVYYTSTGYVNVNPSPDANSVINLKVGQTLALNYQLGSGIVDPSKVTWTIYGNSSTGKISLSGNNATGVTAGTVYLQAAYGGASTVVQLNITGSGSIIAGDDVYKVKPTALNVRSGPGTGYSVIGVLYKGDLVAGYGKTNGWMKINFNGQTAYVAGNQLTK